MSSPICLDRFQSQNRDILHEHVDMLDETVVIFDGHVDILEMLDKQTFPMFSESVSPYARRL